MTRTSTRRRTRGRPADGEAVRTREALLDAAVALFGEQGVAATASAAIAKRAGVTPAMVHYHFRDRERLLDAVADERLGRFYDQVFADLPPSESDDPAALIETIVRRVHEVAEQMPWVPPIWIREVVAEGGTLRERMLRRAPINTFQVLVDLFKREQRSHRLPDGIEPRLVLNTIAGIAMLPLATRRLWSRLPGMADLTNAQLLRHALTVIASGLAPAQRKPRKRRDR